MNILCFGDSNTHGYNPENSKRYPRDVRFTGILQEELGDDFYIIEEGLNGRTTVFKDAITDGLCGIDYIVPCIRTHAPLDLIIVMLGTNDVKERFGANAEVINLGMQKLIKMILNTDAIFRHKKNVLLVSPPIIKDGVYEITHTMGKGCEQKSKELISLYEQTAKDLDLFYLKASDYAEFSDIDKMHLDPEGHKKLAKAFKEKILQIKEIL